MGYKIEDDLMLLGNASFQTSSSKGTPNSMSLGVGGRYYIEQNGIYLGVNAKFVHTKSYNDFSFCHLVASQWVMLSLLVVR